MSKLNFLAMVVLSIAISGAAYSAPRGGGGGGGAHFGGGGAHFGGGGAHFGGGGHILAEAVTLAAVISAAG